MLELLIATDRISRIQYGLKMLHFFTILLLSFLSTLEQILLHANVILIKQKLRSIQASSAGALEPF